ncbi:MAG: aminoacyl-tRNA hydrolase [Dysgonamonadaceae bacterium]|jgi:ribosome-associated protein|nr:aminoacyl-tRNA hydrolase [Dysgonamonadaceae bacterium]
MSPDIEKLLEECVFSAVRSSGSGGQNVNKVATKVILTLDVEASSALSEQQKTLVREKLATRINKEGILQIDCDTERSQFLNKRAIIKKFQLLIAKALKENKKRIATKPTLQSIRRRIDDKKHQSEKKKGRSGEWD